MRTQTGRRRRMARTGGEFETGDARRGYVGLTWSSERNAVLTADDRRRRSVCRAQPSYAQTLSRHRQAINVQIDRIARLRAHCGVVTAHLGAFVLETQVQHRSLHRPSSEPRPTARRQRAGTETADQRDRPWTGIASRRAFADLRRCAHERQGTARHNAVDQPSLRLGGSLSKSATLTTDNEFLFRTSDPEAGTGNGIGWALAAGVLASRPWVAVRGLAVKLSDFILTRDDPRG